MSTIGSGTGLNRLFEGSQGMQYARMAEQLGLPSNLAQMAGAQIDAQRGDIAGMQRLLQAATAGISTGTADKIFGKGLPPAGFVPRPAAFLAAGAAGALAAGVGLARPFPFGHGFNPFGGVSREKPFGTGMVGRSIERAIKNDPTFKAAMERQLGGVIIPDNRNDGKLTIWRPPFSQVGGILRQAITAGMLPAVGIGGAIAGIGVAAMSGAMAANAVGGSILRGLQRLEGNIASFMGGVQNNNVDGSRASLVNDKEAAQHANSMGIDLKNATFEDIIFLLLMKYTAKKEKEIMNKVNQLGANGGADGKSDGGGIGGFLKNLAGGALPLIGTAVGGPIGGLAGSLLGGAIQNSGSGATNGNVFDANGNVGDPSKMSETAKQQALQKLMGDLSKLYEMLSNMIKSMHDMQMTPVRNLRG